MYNFGILPCSCVRKWTRTSLIDFRASPPSDMRCHSPVCFINSTEPKLSPCSRSIAKFPRWHPTRRLLSFPFNKRCHSPICSCCYDIAFRRNVCFCHFHRRPTCLLYGLALVSINAFTCHLQTLTTPPLHVHKLFAPRLAILLPSANNPRKVSASSPCSCHTKPVTKEIWILIYFFSKKKKQHTIQTRFTKVASLHDNPQKNKKRPQEKITQQLTVPWGSVIKLSSLINLETSMNPNVQKRDITIPQSPRTTHCHTVLPEIQTQTPQDSISTTIPNTTLPKAYSWTADHRWSTSSSADKPPSPYTCPRPTPIIICPPFYITHQWDQKTNLSLPLPSSNISSFFETSLHQMLHSRARVKPNVFLHSSSKSGDWYLFTSEKSSSISISTHLSFHYPKTHVASPFLFRHGPTRYLPMLRLSRNLTVSENRISLSTPSLSNVHDKKAHATWRNILSKHDATLRHVMSLLLHPRESIHLPCSHCSCCTYEEHIQRKMALQKQPCVILLLASPKIVLETWCANEHNRMRRWQNERKHNERDVVATKEKIWQKEKEIGKKKDMVRKIRSRKMHNWHMAHSVFATS